MLTKKGFTLIEILVVVLIIGILAAIAVPKYQIAVLKSKLSRAKQTVSDIEQAGNLYYLQNGTYPTKFIELDFANKFSSNGVIKTEDYECWISKNNDIRCFIDSQYGVSYLYNFAKKEAMCRAQSIDKTDINNKLCQQDTGQTASQAVCSDTSVYCNYYY